MPVRRGFDFASTVWVPDEGLAFVLAKITDIGIDEMKVEYLCDSRKTKSFPYDAVYPADRLNAPDVDDNCALMFLNQATVLDNIRKRYAKDKIYTYVANILLAINPYKAISSMYDLQQMSAYNGKSLGTLSPHVFAIGDKAYRDMKQTKTSHSIIVSGESGSGKTESVKYILRYLTTSYGQQSGVIEERLVDSNPLLEAFGNAKTTRNNNSSRFGKFIELHFSKDYRISGGFISHYLLERTRICHQSKGERNYHIFYQLCCSADPHLRQRLHLQSPDQFAILCNGCTQYFVRDVKRSAIVQEALSEDHKRLGALYDIQLDDAIDFFNCKRAMHNMGINEQRQNDIFEVVAAIMHLGNVGFEVDADSTEGGCKLRDDKLASLRFTSELLSVPVEYMEDALTSRTMQPRLIGGRPGSLIKVPLRVGDALHARDALCKTIYVRLFDYVVNTINESIPPSGSSSYYIGMLDIAGFEYFPVNSFEHFCINYCNERLQQFFNGRILRDEQDIYEHEGLGVRHIEYVDNQDCIDLIEGKNLGILDILDEESRLPQPNFTHFTSEVFNKNKKHQRLDLPRKSHLKLYREIRDDEGFLIRHFAGAVVYSTAQFIEKNNDAIHSSLITVIRDNTKSDFLKHLFMHHEDKAMAEGKLNFISVGSKFRSQLHGLIDRLAHTGTSFVRCIKPNDNMRPLEFDGPHILTQLQCAGMLSVLDLMQQGFPSRAKFSVLYGLYQKYMPPEVAKLDPRFFCKGLFACMDMSLNDFRFGLTMVFFKPGKFAEFDTLMREDPDNLRHLVNKFKHWLHKARWRKAQYYVWTFVRVRRLMLQRKQTIIRLQSIIRMFNDRKRYRFRIVALGKLGELSQILQQLESEKLLINQQLKDMSSSLSHEMNSFKESLRNDGDISAHAEQWTRSTLSTLSTKVNNLLQESTEATRRQKIENERLAQLQREKELYEQRRKEEEQKVAKEAEEARKQAEAENQKRREIEERRIREQERISNLDKELQRAATEQMRKRELELLKRKKAEQSRIDHHLAQRLAAASGSEVEPLSSIIGMPGAKRIEEVDPKFSYLTKWKYAQLRDTINTSCDIELLQACREEFHRRLRAYHNWKSKNRVKGAPVERRVPQEIVEAIENMRAIVGDDTVMDNEQRYFKVKSKNNATWYGHFDGKWICRQMQISDGESVRPLIAGIDDIDMCELQLSETNLTSDKGTEILESDFEKVWNDNGGLQYMAENYSRISSRYLQEKARAVVNLLDF